jgi:hypothetical protein
MQVRTLRQLAAFACACTVGLVLAACASHPADAEYNCKAPPSDLAACSVDADCTTVAIGCYCGPQPVNGVASRYAITAQACEDTAASTCALGCPNELAVIAQNGKKAETSTDISVHCDHSTGTGAGAGICKSALP